MRSTRVDRPPRNHQSGHGEYMSTSEDTSSTELSVQDKLKEAVIIGTWSSKCGGCGKDTDPYAETHEHVIGFGPGGPGCGITWRFVTTDYPHLHERVREMRPDLEYFDQWPQTEVF